jgi:hypothetical protein
MTTRILLGALARGLAAGLAGTAVMTAAQAGYYKLQDAEASTVPAEVAKRVIRGVLQRKVDEDKTGLLNNVMHWGYGSGLGIVYGLAQGNARGRALPAGLAFGTAVWAASLAHLRAMQLAPPAWEQPPSQLASDAAFHLIYGTAAAGTYAALGG